MKLSEMTTDEVTETLLCITPYAANIMGDKELMDKLGESVKGATTAQLFALGANKITQIAPMLLKDHKTDVYSILGALNGKTAEEVGKQSFIETMKQIREAVQDKELRDFFKSWKQEEGTT